MRLRRAPAPWGTPYGVADTATLASQRVERRWELVPNGLVTGDAGGDDRRTATPEPPSAGPTTSRPPGVLANTVLAVVWAVPEAALGYATAAAVCTPLGVGPRLDAFPEGVLAVPLTIGLTMPLALWTLLGIGMVVEGRRGPTVVTVGPRGVRTAEHSRRGRPRVTERTWDELRAVKDHEGRVTVHHHPGAARVPDRGAHGDAAPDPRPREPGAPAPPAANATGAAPPPPTPETPQTPGRADDAGARTVLHPVTVHGRRGDMTVARDGTARQRREIAEAVREHLTFAAAARGRPPVVRGWTAYEGDEGRVLTTESADRQALGWGCLLVSAPAWVSAAAFATAATDQLHWIWVAGACTAGAGELTRRAFGYFRCTPRWTARPGALALEERPGRGTTFEARSLEISATSGDGDPSCRLEALSTRDGGDDAERRTVLDTDAGAGPIAETARWLAGAAEIPVRRVRRRGG